MCTLCLIASCQGITAPTLDTTVTGNWSRICGGAPGRTAITFNCRNHAGLTAVPPSAFDDAAAIRTLYGRHNPNPIPSPAPTPCPCDTGRRFGQPDTPHRPERRNHPSSSPSAALAFSLHTRHMAPFANPPPLLQALGEQRHHGDSVGPARLHHRAL